MPKVLLRFALLLVLVPACGSGDSADSSSDCQTACNTAASLKCPNDSDCVAKCQQLANGVPKCKSQFAAFIKCSAGHPASDWECGPDGKSDLKDGVCDPEGEAAAMCLLGGTAP